MRRDKQKKSIEGWFNKPVFFSMVALTLASSLTACSSIVDRPVIGDRATITDTKITMHSRNILLDCTIEEDLYHCHVRDK